MGAEFFYDRPLVVRGNRILLPMTVLEAALLRFEWLQLCYSVSSQTVYGRGGQLVLAMFVMKGLCYLVSADVRVIHAHEIDIHIATQSVIGGWGGAKASEQVDQSNDLNPISAIGSAIDLAEEFAIDSTIDLAKDLTIALAKI